MTIKDLKERWKAECTEFGQFLKHGVGSALLIVAGIGGLAEYFGQLPQIISDAIPQWVKIAVFICGAIAHLAGGFTVKKKEDGNV